eukprot:544526-Alexandrium_andersonii.AAC.1
MAAQDRRDIWRDWLLLLDAVKPEWAIAETVGGFHDIPGLMLRHREQAEEAGYRVITDTLNVRDWHPQDRSRTAL